MQLKMEMVKPVGVLTTTTREEKNLNYQVHIISFSPYFPYLHRGHVLKAELPKHKINKYQSYPMSAGYIQPIEAV